VLPALKLSTAQTAAKLGVSRQRLHNVLTERCGVSLEMALRIGKFCGNGPDTWLRLQQAHDLWHAERRLAKEVARIPTVALLERAKQWSGWESGKR
jgi:addiction module HigA family antidote